MVEERNAFITTMKSEIYRKEYLNDTERTDLHTQLLHKDTLVKKLEVYNMYMYRYCHSLTVYRPGYGIYHIYTFTVS